MITIKAGFSPDGQKLSRKAWFFLCG